jgi:uncharacterized protein YjdB
VKYLELLDIQDKGLTGTLDLSGCTNLTELSCGDNQISILNVSNLTNLTVLNCYNTQISTLDVSSLTNLTGLNCINNQISTLDVSNLTNLTVLFCYNNQISTLDVSNLTNLTVLFCGSNQISTLDVSNLTNLTVLDCPSNQISTLNVSNLTSLTYLTCYHNQISTLDVSSLTNLGHLSCSGNYIASKANLTGLSNIESNLTTFDFDPQFTIALSSNSLSLAPNATSQLSATTPTWGKNRNVTWSSDNTSIATVSSSGLVTAKAAGTTRIYAKSAVNPLIEDSCTVTVTASTVAVTGINLDPASLNLTTGQGEQLTATVQPTNATNQGVTWSSSDNSVATVSTTGLVSAVAEGTATITARTDEGSFEATCTVTVTASTVAVTGISLDLTWLNLTTEQSEQLTATVQPTNASDQNVTWSSSDNSVATVSTTGLVSAVAEGTATITARTDEGGFEATCTVTVTASTVAVTGVWLEQTSVSLPVGDSVILYRHLEPVYSTNPDVTWTSSNPDVATIEPYNVVNNWGDSCLVRAIAAGESRITVRTDDGGFEVTCAVTVQPVQAVTGDEDEPAGQDGTGRINVSLEIPSEVLFNGSFRLTLPGGMSIDVNATKLADGLMNGLVLTIIQNADGSWLFKIDPKTLSSLLRSAVSYQQIVNIVYKVDESVADGGYEVKISDVNFTFDDGTTIIEPEIPVQITVDHSYVVGTDAVMSSPNRITIINNVLHIDTSVEETVSIYSVAGSVLYQAKKPVGELQIPLPGIDRQILIIRGSSGWVRKNVRL